MNSKCDVIISIHIGFLKSLIKNVFLFYSMRFRIQSQGRDLQMKEKPGIE